MQPDRGEDGESVRGQHAQRGARRHEQRRRVAGAQRHRGQLRLVTHLGKEEDDGGRGERPPPGMLARLVRRVGHEGPHAEGDEGQPEDHREDPRRYQAGEPHAHRCGEGVVEEGGEEDPQHDRPRPPVARGQGKGNELRLVAHLGQRHHGERGPERGHPAMIPRGLRRRSGLARSEERGQVAHILESVHRIHRLDDLVGPAVTQHARDEGEELSHHFPG